MQTGHRQAFADWRSQLLTKLLQSGCVDGGSSVLADFEAQF